VFFWFWFRSCFYIQTDRQADRQTGRQTDRQTGRQTNRQADRQTGKQADRQAGRQIDRPHPRPRRVVLEIEACAAAARIWKATNGHDSDATSGTRTRTKKTPEYLTTLSSVLPPEAVASAGARDDASGGAGAREGGGAGATASADAGHVSIREDHEHFPLVGMGLTKHAAVKSALEHHAGGCTCWTASASTGTCSIEPTKLACGVVGVCNMQVGRRSNEKRHRNWQHPAQCGIIVYIRVWFCYYTPTPILACCFYLHFSVVCYGSCAVYVHTATSTHAQDRTKVQPR
jgi:hypothetical protein